MSQCIVPNWDLRKEQDEGEAGQRSSHVHSQHHDLPAPMSNYEVAELIWENGHVAMHGLGGPARMPSTKSTFDASDTLESLVHQATYHKCTPDPYNYDCRPENMNSVVASSGGKWGGDSLGSSIGEKREKPEPSQQNQCSSSIVDGHVSRTFQETDTNTLTWAGSLMQTLSADEDSACRSELKKLDEERDNKTETDRSFTTRRSRAATVHNQSERRRRDRINQKMKTLQKLVPNARKTDKASILDEVIEYLKQLQSQLNMMSMSNMSQMMMPLGMQQQLQMSLLARMGMGMGMLDVAPANRAAPQTIPSILHPTATAPAATPPFVPPPFLIPSLMSAHSTARANPHPIPSQPIHLPDPYAAFLTQSMNVDLYNKMADLYRQQINQTTQVGAPLHGSSAPHG